jgi:hypothetical protein
MFHPPKILTPVGTPAHCHYTYSYDNQITELNVENSARQKKLQAAWDRYAKDVGVVMSK